MAVNGEERVVANGEVRTDVEVTKHNLATGEKDVISEERKQEIIPFELEPCEMAIGDVGVGFGMTLSLPKKYEMARVNAWVRLPALAPDKLDEFVKARITPALERATQIAAAKLDELVSEVEEARDGK